jgi:glycosyltransferase involved in cell wall biosynthesis
LVVRVKYGYHACHAGGKPKKAVAHLLNHGTPPGVSGTRVHWHGSFTMSDKKEHITVCICTFKRPEFLRRLLEAVARQKTGGAFSYSVVVVDNDVAESARSVVTECAASSDFEVAYHVEPTPNIAQARNMALRKARGDFAALIDDDEFPTEGWLFELRRACLKAEVDGVLGPVEPHFAVEPPKWIRKIKLFHHPHYETGYLLHWDETRSGNVLLKRTLFNDESNLFDRAFATHGEDKDFFKRLTQKGHKFIWCDEAVAFETQPANRLTRKYHLRRALLRGSVAYTHASGKLATVLTSCAAVCLYTFALPFLQLSGHHKFMKYLIKDCDHLGKILASLGYKVEKHIRSL